MGKIRTDREILRCLYDMYHADYPGKGDPLVPVDIPTVAKRLGCTPELLFGRLYYDMGTRLRYRDPKDPRVTLASIFEPVAGSVRHVVNFPYLTAVLAGQEEQRRRDLWTTGLAVLAIVVAVGSAIVQWMSENNSRPEFTLPNAAARDVSHSSASVPREPLNGLGRQVEATRPAHACGRYLPALDSSLQPFERVAHPPG